MLDGPRATRLRRRGSAEARRRLRRLRGAAAPILQTTVAAALAWWLARRLLPEPRPLFAPLGAIIALGATTGERGTRAVQVAAGVAIGIAAAAVVVDLLGPGTLQLALVTAIALTISVVVSDSPTFVVQAGVSGALVVAVGGSGVVGYDRLFEALVGGAVALAFSQVLFPVDVVRAARQATAGAVAEVGHALADWAAAAAHGDPDGARAAEGRLRATAGAARSAGSTLHAGQRTVRLSRLRLTTRDRLRRYAALHAHLDELADAAHATVLAAAPLVGDDHPAPAPVTGGVEALARAAECLAARVEHPDGDLAHVIEEARRQAAGVRAQAGDATLAVAAARMAELAAALARAAGDQHERRRGRHARAAAGGARRERSRARSA
ncbi:MAG TPA: FUSC family protein [Baekduia sp.]|nr:FUSC family protein [Baekduia sp.]